MMVTNHPAFPPIHPTTGKCAHGVRSSVDQTRAEGSYDRFQQTTPLSEKDQFQMELVSRITQEIRTAVTTGDIQELRGQIRKGEYEPDAAEIAARMLLMEAHE